MIANSISCCHRDILLSTPVEESQPSGEIFLKETLMYGFGNDLSVFTRLLKLSHIGPEIKPGHHETPSYADMGSNLDTAHRWMDFILQWRMELSCWVDPPFKVRREQNIKEQSFANWGEKQKSSPRIWIEPRTIAQLDTISLVHSVSFVYKWGFALFTSQCLLRHLCHRKCSKYLVLDIRFAWV